MTTEEIIAEFCKQCQRVKTLYNEYRCLYESGKDRLDLLENNTHKFFYNLQDILIKYIILNICALTDPARSRGNNNLTIKYVLRKIDPTIRKNLGLSELSKEIHEFRGYIKKARDKIIAHLDVKIIDANKTLGVFPQNAEKKFWIDVQEFVNRIYKHYLADTFPLDLDSPCEAEDLVYALKKAAYFDHHFRKVVHSSLLEEKDFRYRNA